MIVDEKQAKAERGASDGRIVLDALGNAPFRQAGIPALINARPLALHAMISSAGLCREAVPAAYDWHGIRRGSAEFVLLQYTLAGRGQLSYEGKEHAVLPGQVMLLFFPHDNRYWLPAGASWEFFYLCMHGREVMRAWRQVIARHGPLLDLAATSPSLQYAARTCADVLAGTVADQFSASALAYTLAMRLLSEFGGDPRPLRRDPGIARAKEVVRARFAENIGVEDLAKAAGFSRYHFSRLFTASEGVSPAAYIVQQRLRTALRMLRDSDAPVGEVAVRCGFSDATYFCRVFRKAMGLSPGEFRHSGMY